MDSKESLLVVSGKDWRTAQDYVMSDFREGGCLSLSTC